MPQGLVLVLTLFLIYVNDFESYLLLKEETFAYDIKLGGKEICSEYCDKMQVDHNELIDWTEKNVIFYTAISKIMYIGDKIQISNPKSNVRVVHHWTTLPASVVSSKTLDSFKSRLDIYFRETVFY